MAQGVAIFFGRVDLLWRGPGGDEARILGFHMTPALQAIGHCPLYSKSVPNVALSSPSDYQMFLGPTWVTSTLPPTGPGGGGDTCRLKYVQMNAGKWGK